MYRPNPKNFALNELLPPEVIERFGESGLMVLNPLFCISLQQLRNRFGRMRFNSPKLGLTQRSVRTLRYFLAQQKNKTTLSGYKAAALAYDRYFGMHKYGCAGDVDFLDTPLVEVIAYIRENPDEFPFISFIEVDRSWFHFDTRNQANLTFWSPDRGVVEVVKKKAIDWSLLVDIEGTTFKGTKK